jgi:hypothetical protein
MATEPGRATRPRPWLLVLLGVVVAAYLVTRMFSGQPAGPAVTTPGARPAAQPIAPVDPSELDVRIEALGDAPTGPGEGGRNPFRFQPKPPPPAAPLPQRPALPPPAFVPSAPAAPAGPPAIGTLIKFIGIVDTGKEKIGAFSDCRSTFSGREGEIIEGRFRVVRIGVESAVLEYVDGAGRTTLPLNGQACVGK